MKTEPTISIQDEVAKIHAQYGTTEMANYRIEKLLEKYIEQSFPKIKQLEWEGTNMWYFKAKTSLGLGYSITEIKGTYIVHFGDAPISWEKSLESAKAAAQADFEKRINECLE